MLLERCSVPGVKQSGVPGCLGYSRIDQFNWSITNVPSVLVPFVVTIFCICAVPWASFHE